jgi:pSer/pThr/pTyr-binding forkhead associated (FHA) protein
MNEQAQERFRAACGLSAPLALECIGPSQPEAAVPHLFELPFVLVGRHPRADLFLDDRRVSRRHVFLQAVSGRILATDLESRSKVFWNGEETPRTQGWLELEDSIRVGPFRIRQHDGDVMAGPLGELPAATPRRDQERSDSASVPGPALELPMRVGDGPARWPVEGHLALVGRAETCQLVLTDDSISQFHAALLPTPSGLWVVNLLAREGVNVNGERVRWAWLADGDALRIGRFTFVLRYENPPDGITRQDVSLEAGASPLEGPGTALAISVGSSEAGRRDPVGRREGGSRVALKVVGAPSMIEPDAVVPSGAEVWEPANSYPATPMAMWQQQMQLMESFHNDMILMVQMFVAMHREHSASVRHELDMVQQLTRELSALQARTGQSPASANADLPAGIDRPDRESGPAEATDRGGGQRKPLLAQPDDGGHPARPKSTTPAARSEPAGSGAPSAQESGPIAPDMAPGVDDQQIHALLTRRIAELQRERQGYWQRILRTINR